MNIIGFAFRHTKLLLMGGVVALLAVVATLPLWGSAFHVGVVQLVLLYIILGTSWAMFSGTTGYMSLAPAAFFGLGIHAKAFFQYTLPLPIIVLIGAAWAFALALLIGLVTLRLRGMYFAIFTFGLVVFMTEMFHYLDAKIGGIHGRPILPLDELIIVQTLLGIAVVTVVATYFIRRSRFGLAMLSIGGNEDAAEHMGVNTTMVKILGFAITAIPIGAAGAIAASIFLYINPTIAFSPYYSFMPILSAVFGGMGQLYGPVIGAVIFGYLEKTLMATLYMYFMLAFGATLVLVITFLPNGVASLVPKLQGKLQGVIARSQKGGRVEQHANT